MCISGPPFVGANPHPRLDTHVSYPLGDDPAKWRTDVPVWGGVRYVDLYPWIDLEVGERRGLRLIAHPGAAPSTVRLRVKGADEIAMDGDRLRLNTAIGAFSLPPFLSSDGWLL